MAGPPHLRLETSVKNAVILVLPVRALYKIALLVRRGNLFMKGFVSICVPRDRLHRGQCVLGVVKGVSSVSLGRFVMCVWQGR